MELTLEKIMRYLEDRLTPSEVLEFSLFLQEHPEAQTLLARVEKHLRTRTLQPEEGLPDPQMVAAYLDGILTREALEELELKTLADDPLLHDLAASHFCLSTAPEGKNGYSWSQENHIDWGRMLDLVKNGRDDPGRRRKLSSRPTRTSRKNVWRFNRRHVVVGTAAFLLLLVAVMGMVLRSRPEFAPAGKLGHDSAIISADLKIALPALPPKDPGQEPSAPPAQDPAPIVELANPSLKMVPLLPQGERQGRVGKLPVMPEADRNSRMPLGHLVDEKSVLVRTHGSNPSWRRVDKREDLLAQDHLMALPGYSCALEFANGPRMVLWGNLPEASQNLMVQESEVRLLPAGNGVDAEIELLEGRVYLRCPGVRPVTWRVRFRDQAWDVALETPLTEVLVELVVVPFGKANWREGEDPVVQVVLGVVTGSAGISPHAGLKIPLAAPPGNSVFIQWNSTKGVVQGPFPTNQPLWSSDWQGPPGNQAVFRAALLELEAEMRFDLIPSVGLENALNGKNATPSLRHAAIFSLGCLGDHVRLLSEMNDEGVTEDRRQSAAGALRHWVGEAGDRRLILFNPSSGKGYLVDKLGHSPDEASLLLDLLHPPNLAEIQDKKNLFGVAELLQHERMTIRVAAQRYLADLNEDPFVGGSPVRFDSKWLIKARRAATTQWQKLVQDGRIPGQRGTGLEKPDIPAKNATRPNE